jgi:hypothetical protein
LPLRDWLSAACCGPLRPCRERAGSTPANSGNGLPADAAALQEPVAAGAAAASGGLDQSTDCAAAGTGGRGPRKPKRGPYVPYALE